jgi:ribosomal peptide maturation radical SAM protein 1
MTEPASRIALVNMPFGPADRASIQIAILKSLLDDAALPSTELHFNLDFFDLLRQHGLEKAYSSTLPSTVGEWFFARHAQRDNGQHDDGEADPLDRLRSFAAEHGASVDDIRAFRDEVIPEFIAAVIDSRDWSGDAAVAFTMTFPQVNASLWLAEELKARHPQLKVILGGAMSQLHHQSAAEYMRVFSCVDFIVVGEAEPVFAPLCRAIVDAKGAHVTVDLPGVFARDAQGAVVPTTTLALAENMSTVPFPDYRGFFARRATLPQETAALITNDILIELSRGCAWAVKNVCTFCGFYPDGGFRVKANARVLEEIRTQREQTGANAFYVVDAYVTRNMISNLFSQLPREEPGITFPFVELKSDITKLHVEILAKAGVTLVQPGIEVLEESLLERIHKGVTLEDNLLLLKWCREQSVAVSYNILMGIPDATVEEETRQLFIMRRIAHLAPPFLVPLFIVRASTYERAPERYGLTNVRADPFYKSLFPAELDIERVAYELAYDADRSAHEAIHDETRRVVETWRAFWQPPFPRPSFTCDFIGDEAHLTDARDPRFAPVQVTLIGDDVRVLAATMDRAKSIETIARETGVDEGRVREIVDRFVASATAIETDAKVLALPTHKVANAPRALIGEMRRRRTLRIVEGERAVSRQPGRALARVDG